MSNPYAGVSPVERKIKRETTLKEIAFWKDRAAEKRKEAASLMAGAESLDELVRAMEAQLVLLEAAP